MTLVVAVGVAVVEILSFEGSFTLPIAAAVAASLLLILLHLGALGVRFQRTLLVVSFLFPIYLAGQLGCKVLGLGSRCVIVIVIVVQCHVIFAF